MVLSEDDLPGKRPLPVPGAGGNRPRPAGGGNRPDPLGGGLSNRPILLQSRSDLPEQDDEDEEEDQEDTDIREILRNAPAWLVSTVFHMLLLILLGLWAYAASTRDQQLEVEVTYAESLGEQLSDPAMLESNGLELDTAPENIITPPDLAPVDDPLAMPPALVDIDLNLPATTATATDRITSAPIGLALKGREAGSRAALLKKYGGTAETEHAVEAGLAWLVKQQRDNGLWSMSGPYADEATYENQAAATAMALLAFQGHGDTHLSGQYKDTVRKGWDALLKLQKADGQFIGDISLEDQRLYTHAQCTIAACELYGMTDDSRFHEPAMMALRFAANAQDQTLGGWRYRPRVDSDTSVTGWFVMAFQSARMAKLSFPPTVLQRAGAFLDKVQLDDGRAYVYQPNRQRTNAVTAEGLLCRQYLGWRQNDPRLVEGISYLVEKVPLAYDSPNLDCDVYYWYYCTQAAHHMEGKIWTDWNSIMRQEVPARQVKSGPEAGSWSPVTDRWGFNGRLYVTCLSIYMLEVYYRHLPIYSGYQFVEGVGKTMDPDAKPDPTAPVTDADVKPAGDKASGAEPGEPMIDPIEAPGTPPPRGSATRTKS
jgi:hypothetical protein